MATRNRVLVVDDNVAVGKFVASVLVPLGYRVERAGDGLEALARVAKEPFDLVLLDLIMPRMNGFQFCLALERKKLLSQVPVVLLSSAREKVVDRVKQETGRLTDFLPKPITATLLKKLMKKYLPLQGAAVPTPAPDNEIHLEVDQLSSDDSASGPQELRSVLRDRLEKAVLEALSPKLVRIAAAKDPQEELSLITEVVGAALSDSLLDEVIRLVSGKQDRSPL